MARDGTDIDQEAAFRSLYWRHEAPISAYVRRRVQNGDEAGDIVAEVFATAWRKGARLEDETQMRLWLFGVARRTLANYKRGNFRRSRLLQRLADETANSNRGEDASRLAEALAQLPKKDREILRLAAWEGLSHQDIASIFGCSRNAIDVRMSRAYGRIRKVLETSSEIDPNVRQQVHPSGCTG